MNIRSLLTILVALIVLPLTALPAHASASTDRMDRMEAATANTGGSILHIGFSLPMTGTGVDADARGTLKGNLTCQGDTDNESLKLSMQNLDPVATYELTALTGDDPLAASILGMTTDDQGSFLVKFAKGGPRGGNPDTVPLPALLDPTSNILELGILDASSQPVLTADLAAPLKLEYLLMRRLVSTGLLPSSAGNIRIKATESVTNFTLVATGLAPNTDYIFSINGTDAVTVTSNGSGVVVMNSLPPNPPAALDINSLALADAVSGSLVLTSGALGIPEICVASSSLGGHKKVNLGSAARFAVLSGSTVTNVTGTPTVVTGDLGVFPGTAVTGFGPGSGTVIGTIHAGDTTAGQAQSDLTIAFNNAAGRTLGPVSVAGNLGGQTLPPGLYKSTSSLEISSGDLTLDARGNSNAVWIFQIASTLVTTSGRQVILSGGARASHVFWQVGTSATIGTTSSFKGTIMADQAISILSGARLEGRALARIAAVTMDGNAVTIPAE